MRSPFTTDAGQELRGAHYYRWDLPGGWLLVPGGADVRGVDGVVDGTEIHWAR